MRFFSLLPLLALLVSALGAAPGGSSWIGHVRGEVKVDGQPARNGQSLQKGSRIQTGDGTASLFLSGQALIRIGKGTDATVASLVSSGSGKLDAEVSVQEGKLRVLVRSAPSSGSRAFRVRTKGAVMGVRGTQVVIDSPANGPPAFLVIEGKAEVSVAGGPTVALGALERFEVGGAGPVKVTKEQAQEAAGGVAPEAPKASTVFDQLGSVSKAPLDPIVDTAVRKLRVGFSF